MAREADAPVLTIGQDEVRLIASLIGIVLFVWVVGTLLVALPQWLLQRVRLERPGMQVPWREAMLVVGVSLLAGGLADRNDYHDTTPATIALGAACLAAGVLAYDARRRANLAPPPCVRCRARDEAEIRARAAAKAEPRPSSSAS